MLTTLLHAAWHLITRLGEAQILLPAMAAASAWLAVRAGASRLAIAWWASTAVAVALTVITKVAFIGWGLGSAEWNFTGLSGHAMFAAAVLPLLLRLALGNLPAPWPALGLPLGMALAVVVAVSRVFTGHHSWSEVVGGFAVGALAAATALGLARLPRRGLPIWVAPALLVAVVLAMGYAPRSRTHDWVTSLSLKLSGRSVPYTRQQLLQLPQRQHRRAQGLEAPVLGHAQPGLQVEAGLPPAAGRV